MPPVGRVLETSLYVDDVRRSMDFYQRLYGFEPLVFDHRFCAFDVSGQQVLLLFLKGGTKEPIHMPGGMIPPHDGSGTTHLGFTIAASDEAAWTAHLQSAGIAIESRVDWELGGCSLYFRDPDGRRVALSHY